MEVLEEPVSIGTNGVLIQNLGPDILYVGELIVPPENWVPVASNQAISVGGSNTPTYVVSDGTSDVRLLGQGSGMFSSG